MQPRKSQLILFALALGIILAAMYPLFRVPCLHGYAGDFVPATGEVLLSTKSPSRKNTSRILWLNLETGKIHSDRPAALQQGLATAITIESDSQLYFECSAVITNSKGELEWVEFNFPREDYGSAYPKIIGGHFAVATRNQALLYLDLLNPSQGLQEFPLPKLTNNNSSFIDVLGAEYGGEGEKFLVVEYPANTPNRYMGLLEMTATGPKELTQFTTVTEWNSLGDVLYWTHKDSTILQYSLQDGSKLGDLELSDEIQQRRNSPDFRSMYPAGQFLLMRFTSDAGVDTFEYYDLETQERVLELEGTWYPPRRDLFPSPPDAPIVFYQGNSQVEKLMGFDPSTKRIVWTKNYQSDPTILGNLNKHMVLGDGTFGITADVIDPWTGKILHRHRPLMFIAWLLPLVSLALAAWIVLWLRFSASFFPAWLNISWIAGLVLGLLLLYLICIDFLPSSPIIPLFNYQHGILLGLTIAGAGWMVMGRSHAWLRYLPALGILCFLVLVARLLFADQLAIVAEAFTATVVPATLAMLPILFLRWFRFRWLKTSANEDAEAAQSLSIRHLFIAAAGSAAILGALKPAISSLSLPYMNTPVIVGSVCTITCTFLLIVTTQSPARKIHVVSFVLALLLLATLMFEFLFPFITSNVSFFNYRMSQPQVLLRVIASSQLTFFFVLLSYRYQGWRFLRTAK